MRDARENLDHGVVCQGSSARPHEHGKRALQEGKERQEGREGERDKGKTTRQLMSRGAGGQGGREEEESRE